MTPEPQVTGVTELRVHGISGASAEQILDRPSVVRVAGDENAGFYRPQACCDQQIGPAGVTLEAFRWANLTTGAGSRTVSRLLLLPFMLSNVALWMRPAGTRPQVGVQILCRVLAGHLTAMYVLSLVGAFVDLVGWQCTRHPSCTADRGYLTWLVRIPVGPRLALLCVVPIAGIWLAGWLGARSYRHYEIVRPTATDTPRGVRGRLDAPGFWNRAREVRALRMTHQAIALGVLAVTVLPAFAAWPSPAAVLLGPVVLILVTGFAVLCVPEQVGERAARWSFTTARWVRTAAAALTVTTLGVVALATPPSGSTGALPGIDPLVSAVFVGAGVLVAMLVVACGWVAYRSPPVAAGRSRLGRLAALGAPVATAAGVGFGSAYASELLYRVADLLDGGDIPGRIPPSGPGQPPLEPPLAFRWAGLGALLALLLVLVFAAVWFWWHRWRRLPAATDIARRDFPEVPPEDRPRVHRLRERIVRAQFVERLPLLLAVFLVLLLLSLLIAVLEVAQVGPTRLRREDGPVGTELADTLWYLTDAGSVLVAVAAVLVLFGGLVVRPSWAKRRTIGVLWDLGTFWPRVTHPFAPTCYASRAVPDLVRRVRFLARSGPVLLTGHSHGSVLLAAAVLQLPPQILPRVALLTYGSPLRRLYAELMPAYLGDDVLREVGERVGWRWRNLWRDTDPIGGAVFPYRDGDAAPPAGRDGSAPPAGVDRRLRDPRDVTVPFDDTVPAPIEGHWPYHTHPCYEEAVAELVGMLRARR